MALPVSLESVFQMSFNVVDQIIVGLLGVTAVAAVGLSNSVAAIAILLCAAIGTGSGVLIAQAYGRKDMNDVARTAAAGLRTDSKGRYRRPLCRWRRTNPTGRLIA